MTEQARSARWWDTASAHVLGDYRRDVWARDNVARSRVRLVAVACMVAVLIALAAVSFVSEPSLRSRTYTYRITNPDRLPSGERIVSWSCPCSKEMLLWSGFVSWPRFATPDSSGGQAITTYCSQLLDNPAPSLPVVPVGQPSAVAPEGSGDNGPPALSPSSPSPSPTLALGPAIASLPDDSPPPEGRHHRRRLQAPAADPAQAARTRLVRRACSAWVQDILAALDPSNLVYAAEAYQASQLKQLDNVRDITLMWLGGKLKYHLQIEYRIAVATSGSDAASLPASFRELMSAMNVSVERMLGPVHAEIRDNI